jgi:hypothetical protein
MQRSGTSRPGQRIMSPWLMARTSSFSLTRNWKMKMTTMTCPEEDDDESTEEDPTVGCFLRVWSSDKDDDGDDGGDSDDGATGDDGSTNDDGAGDDGSGSDSGDDDEDVSAVPPFKGHRYSGTYWW